MTLHLNILRDCETCEGTSMVMEDSGFMKGVVAPCPDCAFDYKKFINQYGTDEAENPDVYVDTDKGVLKKVEQDQQVLYLPGGGEINLLNNN